MNLIRAALPLAAVLVLLTAPLSAQTLSQPPGGANQKSVVTQYMGLTSVTIDYNSPDVTAPNGQDRTGKIWGQLVPWGIAPNPFYPGFGTAETMPWRTGANEATKITFSHDVEVEGKSLAAGTYALFMAPGEDTWTVIFNHNSDAWGSFFYDPALDALQVTVTPQATETFKEWLTFEFEDRQVDSTVAVLHWENLRVPFRVSVPNLPELYHERISRELTGAAGFTFQNLVTASRWAMQYEQYQEDALRWADGAVTAVTNFATLANKAVVLSTMGRTDEASETLDQAIEHPTSTPGQIHGVARQLQFAGHLEAAVPIFKKNYEKNAGQWPVDFGMARALAQEGDFEKALEHARIALERAPGPGQKQNVQAQIDRLEKGENINP